MRRAGGIRRLHLAAMLLIAGAGLLLVEALRLLPVAEARVGGGQSYSSRGSSSSSSRSSSSSSGSRSYGGSSSGGGGGGGDIAPLFYFLFSTPAIWIPLVALIAFLYIRSWRNEPSEYSSRDASEADFGGPASYTETQVGSRLEELRKYDPNFSEILFNDFVYTLYARVQEARPGPSLEQLGSYLSADVIRSLRLLNKPEMQDIKGVIIGSSRIGSVSELAGPMVSIIVEFEANYTEAYGGGQERKGREETWYTRESWTFKRRRDLLSRPPEKITALHCPNCGGGLEKRPDGACAYCGAVVTDGSFDWFVTNMWVMERVAQGPLLTQDVPEVGTDAPTRYQLGFSMARQQFMERHPGFSWQQFEARVRYIFMELQSAWTEMRWERARPFETDNVFQTHLYWMTEYRRQRLRNVLEQVEVSRIVPVKIGTDVFYDAITVRVYASMIDYTVDSSGKVLSGNARTPRSFTEYWTFIRRRESQRSEKQNDQCPNCGAALKINMAGVCEYCGGKVTSGDFDWVLSRIEQDESYSG